MISHRNSLLVSLYFSHFHSCCNIHTHPPLPPVPSPPLFTAEHEPSYAFRWSNDYIIRAAADTAFPPQITRSKSQYPATPPTPRQLHRKHTKASFIKSDQLRMSSSVPAYRANSASPSSSRKAVKASASASASSSRPPRSSDPYYGHEETSVLCARFVSLQRWSSRQR